MSENNAKDELTIVLNNRQHVKSLHDYRDAALHAIDFERYSRLIRSLLRTEVGLITFLDEAQQYVLAQSSSTNLEIVPQVLPRELTVCQYTVQQNEKAFVVEDLSLDNKFNHLACVQNDPKLRSYAGFPIKTEEGYNVGSVCALDDHTRTWSQDELELLRDLGRMITNDLDLHFQKKTILMQQKLQSSIVSFIETNMKSSSITDSNSVSLSSQESAIGHNAAAIVRNALEVDSVVVLQLDRRMHSESCAKFTTEVIGRDGQVASEFSCPTDDIVELCGLFKKDNFASMSFSSDLPKALSTILEAHTTSVIVAPWSDSENRLAGFLVAGSNSSSRIFLDYERDYLSAFGSTLMLELQKAKIVDADKSKAQFISSLSHELRTPLHGLLLNAEVLLESSLDSEQVDLLKEIVVCGNSQLSIVESMLSLNRAKKRSNINEPIAVMEVIDVVQVVEDAVTLASNRHRRRMHKHAKSELSHSGNDVQIVIDCTLQSQHYLRQRLSNSKCLSQIVEQLVSNSLKWTSTGFIKIEISLSTDRDKSKVLIDVYDTGSGIHQDFIKHKLFETFTKEDNFSFGLGLGLSLVAAAVAQLKGDIKVDSEKGAYTVVHLAIPMALGRDVPAAWMPKVSAIQTVGLLCPEVPESAGTKLLAQTLRRDLKALCYNVVTYTDVPVEGPSVLFAIEHVHLASLRKQVKELHVVYTGQAAFAMPPGPLRHLSYQLGPHYGPHMLATLLAQIERDVKSSPALLVTADQMSRKRPRSLSRDPNMKMTPSSPLLHDDRNDRATKVSRHDLHSDDRNIHDPKAQGPLHEPKPVPPALTQDAQIAPSPFVTPVKVASQCSETVVSLPPSPRVLIVEDNPTNSRLLARFMQKRGVEYKAVVNGQEAVDEIDSVGTGAEQAYDMILMDIQMPVLDGLEATEKIRQIESMKLIPKAQIVACTGLSADEDKRRATEVGCDRYLTKPISLNTLRHLLDDWSFGQVATNVS